MLCETRSPKARVTYNQYYIMFLEATDKSRRQTSVEEYRYNKIK